MPTRKDEAIASHPLGVAGIVAQVARPDGKSHRGGSHWKSRMTRVGLLDPVRREKAECVDGAVLKIVCHVSTCCYEILYFTIGLPCTPG